MQQLQVDRQSLQVELDRTREASQRQGGQPSYSVVDTRVLSKPESYVGSPTKFPDWSFKMRAYLGAVDERYQKLIERTEMATEPLRNATMTTEDQAQHSIVLHPRADDIGTSADKMPQRRSQRRVRSMAPVSARVGTTTMDKVRRAADAADVVQVPRRHPKRTGSVRETRARLRSAISESRGRRHEDRRRTAGD